MKNKNLEHLIVCSNQIGDDGIKNVVEGLQQNDTLIELGLTSCKISVKGKYSQLS